MTGHPSSIAYHYRQADRSDVRDMARIRSVDLGSEDYWLGHIGSYFDRTFHPEEALGPRMGYVAANANHEVVGFAAGHLTRRFDCEGELAWISVLTDYRAQGIGATLMRFMASWFALQRARRVCVDVSPTNANARRFYEGLGAVPLKRHWYVWDDITLLAVHMPTAGA